MKGEKLVELRYLEVPAYIGAKYTAGLLQYRTREYSVADGVLFVGEWGDWEDVPTEYPSEETF